MSVRVRPAALDLFCCAGGVAKGLHAAGFDVYGVDIRPQPHYPFEFKQANALEQDVEGFYFIWASPPCQAHTTLNKMHNAKQHIDLIPETRAKLVASGIPWVMENVPLAPLRKDLMLCGSMFDLGCAGAELRRHRNFEFSWGGQAQPQCQHGRQPRVIGVYGGHGRDRRRRTVNTQDFSIEMRREAMGISWMNGTELSQAIPPAYAEYIGRLAMRHIGR